MPGTSTQTDVQSFTSQVKYLFTNYNYIIAVGYAFIVCIGTYEGAAWFTLWGASYFGGCNTYKKQARNSSCLADSDNYDFTKYNFYTALFSALTGAVSFLFNGYIGRLSDAYGRKIFLTLYGFMFLVQYIPMIFTDDIWLFYSIGIIGGLTGGSNSMIPVLIAYIADCIPETYRTLAFGLIYCSAAIGILAGTALGTVLTIYFDFYFNFVVDAGICSALIIYSLIFVSETLKTEHRKPFTNQTKCANNPFKTLCRLHVHPIVFWIGILQLFISIPETGALTIATSIVDYILSETNSNSAVILNSLLSGAFAAGLLFGNSILLPILNKYTNNITIMVVGTCSLGLSFVLWLLLTIFKHYTIIAYILVLSGAFCMTTSFIAFSSANAIVTKYLHESEQGEGVGIVYTLKSITFICAPVAFSTLFNLGVRIHFISLVFIVGGASSLIAGIIIIYPLTTAINKIKSQKKRLYFSASNLDPDLLVNDQVQAHSDDIAYERDFTASIGHAGDVTA